MRHTIGGTWLLGLMIVFIMFFVGFIILTINYSRTVRIKNEMIDMFEKYEGLNDSSIELVNNYLRYTTYDATGVCLANGENATGIYGALDLNSTILEPAREGVRYYYCVKKYDGANTSNYYQITIFYKFNLPVIGNTSGFTIKGSTSNFQSNDDKDYCYTISGNCVSNGRPNSNNNNNNSNNSNFTYIVKFDLNGGTGSSQSQYIARGDTANKPDNPTREGYTFEGWQLNGRNYDFNTAVSNNITLVATWKKNSRVPTREEIQGFILWSDKYYKCNVGNTPVKSCRYGYYLRPEYANNRTLFIEEVLKDWQEAKKITFTEKEKEEFRKNWS